MVNIRNYSSLSSLPLCPLALVRLNSSDARSCEDRYKIDSAFGLKSALRTLFVTVIDRT
jgi:hypothetical protein